MKPCPPDRQSGKAASTISMANLLRRRAAAVKGFAADGEAACLEIY